MRRTEIELGWETDVVKRDEKLMTTETFKQSGQLPVRKKKRAKAKAAPKKGSSKKKR